MQESATRQREQDTIRKFTEEKNPNEKSAVFYDLIS